MDWHEAVRIGRTARFPERGKKIANNTRIFLDGPRDAPFRARLRYYGTDILVWHPDEWFVCTDWTTKITLARLREYGGINVRQEQLNAMNGYAIQPNEAYYMRLNGGSTAVHFSGCACVPQRYDNYIRIRGRSIDLESVNSLKIKVVADPAKLRARMLHIGKINKLLLGYLKLLNDDDNALCGRVSAEQWIMERMNTPLESIGLSPFPYLGRSPKSVLQRAAVVVRQYIAEDEGWLTDATLLKTL